MIILKWSVVAVFAAFAGAGLAGAAFADTLTVTKAGSGSGTVTGNVGVIDCGGICSDTYPNGTAIILTATPAAGNQFTGWLGPCTGVGTCQFTINGVTTAAATFAPTSLGAPTLDIDGTTSYDALTDGLLVIRYLFGLSGASLTNGAVGPGAARFNDTQIGDYLTDIRPALDIDGNGQADALTDGLLIIRYLFGLRGANLIAGAVGTDAIRIIAADIESQLLSLLPAATVHPLIVSMTGTGAGAVTSSPPGIDCGAVCSHNYDYGTVVTLTAAASIGSTFSGWGGACAGTSPCLLTVDGAKSVSANFLVQANLVINEVSPNITGGRDLVELLVISGGSLAGMKLEQDLSATVTLTTFPALVVATGDLIVVHMTPTAGETSETTTKGECSAVTCYASAWDIAGVAAGIPFSNRILVVRDSTGAIIDAVPFFVTGNTLSTFPGNLQALQAAGHWLPANCGVLCNYVSTPTATEVSVDWTGSGSTNSVQRKPAADTNTKADWNAISVPTFGLVNP